MRILCPKEVRAPFGEYLLIANYMPTVYYFLSFYFDTFSDVTETLQEQYTEFSYTLYPDFPNVNFLPHWLHHSLPLFFSEPFRVSCRLDAPLPLNPLMRSS